MTVKEELKDFELMNDNDKAREIYALFGVSIYYSQVLEQNIIIILAVFEQIEKKINNQKDLDILWDKYDNGRRTLGNLIIELKKVLKMSENDFSELEEILKLRNYFAHNYFRMNSDLFFSDGGKFRMAKDFIEYKEKSIKMDQLLNQYFLSVSKKIGITEELLQNELERLKKSASNIDVNENFTSVFRKA